MQRLSGWLRQADVNRRKEAGSNINIPYTYALTFYYSRVEAHITLSTNASPTAHVRQRVDRPSTARHERTCGSGE